MYLTQKIKAAIEPKHDVILKWQKEHKGYVTQQTSKWQKEHHEEYLAKQRLYSETRKMANKVIPGGIPEGFALHHAFGEKADCFIIIPTDVHKALHSKFGKKNSKCLWENIEVQKFLMEQGGSFWYVYEGKFYIVR